MLWISIHTPAKGATVFNKLINKMLGGFQSTHPRSVRRLRRTGGRFRVRFQSTHPRRVRLHIIGDSSMLEYFNPHTREGCDSELLTNLKSPFDFNPHTREGCDIFYRLFNHDYWEFQSTHPRRVRRELFKLHPVFPISIHTPRRVHHCVGADWEWEEIFQSTHPRRVRHVHGLSYLDIFQFQSTHPRRVRLFIHLFNTIYSVISIHTPAKGATSGF